MIITTPNDSFFDPFALDGQSLIAAQSLGAKTLFGLEYDEKLCEKANQALQGTTP